MKITIKDGTVTDLCLIMEKNKSDKGSSKSKNNWHNYTVIYNELFKNIRNNNINLFELGIGSINPNNTSNMVNIMGENAKIGASLYGWKEYFQNGQIYGADIDKETLFTANRIKTYYCDQTDPKSINTLWNNSELKQEFDIIVEDGLHEFYANVCFFENSIHKVKSGGYYIIEDIRNLDIYSFEEQIKEWQKKYPTYIFKLLELESNVNFIDNNLLVVIKG